ncbi:hypothetical protein [Duganella sp. OV458]|uniref:hypothetical protein n=1 Tax=Duganella sp. OV458 TaxID=1855290 RepID=UPI0015878032|nr:hypothetical protein [Duganella sp. OV458]
MVGYPVTEKSAPAGLTSGHRAPGCETLTQRKKHRRYVRAEITEPAYAVRRSRSANMAEWLAGLAQYFAFCNAQRQGSR